MTRVTQRDIARRLGLSTSLVSRALSGTAVDIGARPDTIDQIQETARQLGYWPNASAQRLRGAGPATLGAVVSDLEDPFFGPVVAEILRQSHRAGYALALAGMERQGAEPRDLDTLLRNDLSGVIILGGGSHAWASAFRARRLPVVQLGGGPASAGARAVSVNVRAGMEKALDHLLGLGHRRLAFAGADTESHRIRADIFRSVLKSRGLRPDARVIAMGSSAVLNAGAEAVGALLESAAKHPTAIIASSDAVAMGALRALDERGLNVPRDISVTGFDDLVLARLSSPPLTTIRQPIPDLVKATLRLVSEAGPDVEIEPELIVRASTQAPLSSQSTQPREKTCHRH